MPADDLDPRILQQSKATLRATAMAYAAERFYDKPDPEALDASEEALQASARAFVEAEQATAQLRARGTPKPMAALKLCTTCGGAGKVAGGPEVRGRQVSCLDCKGRGHAPP